MRLGVCVALATALAFGSVSASFAAVDPPVAQALQLVQSGRAGEAYAQLAPMAASRAGDPDFDYVLGLAAADSGRSAEAIVAFQRVLAVNPRHAEARAELARAYALAGDADTARKEFDTVVGDPTIPDPVRQRLSRIRDDLDRQVTGGGRDITGYLEAGAGYDSNVNSATASTSLVIPLFAGLGPAALSGGATETEDVFARFDAGVSIVQGLDRRNRVFASLLGSLRENDTEAAFETATINATGGWSHTLADRSVLTGSISHQTFWLGGDRYRQSSGLGAQYTAPAFGGALSGSLQYFDITYKSSPLQNAERVALGASFAWKTGVAAVQGGRERTADPAGDHLSHDFAGVSAVVETPLMDKLSLVSSLAYESRSYEGIDPLFLVRRSDDQLDASLGLRFWLRDGLSLRPQLTATSTESNIALYEYDRFTASIALRSEF